MKRGVWGEIRTLGDVPVKGVDDDSDSRTRHVGLRSRGGRVKWKRDGKRRRLLWLIYLSFCIHRCGFWLCKVVLLSLTREAHAELLDKNGTPFSVVRPSDQPFEMILGVA